MTALKLDVSDLSRAEALRRRLDVLSDPSIQLLSEAQQRQLARLRRLHDCLSIPAPQSPGTSTITRTPTYDMHRIISGLNENCDLSMKRANDAKAIQEAAAMREARMNPELDIKRDVRRALSNTSLVMQSAEPAVAVRPREKWAPEASLLDQRATGRVQFIPDQVMCPAQDDDELDDFLLQQRRICKGCRNPIKKKGFPFRGNKYEARFCYYTGYYYCRDCHSNERRCRIPARCLVMWDFEAYPVCDQAADYLEIINDKPLFCISAHRPMLYAQLPLLATCRQVRLQLGMMYEVGKKCNRFLHAFFTPPQETGVSTLHSAAETHAMAYVPPERRYLVEDCECWSLSDLAVLKETVPNLPDGPDARSADQTASAGSPARGGLRLTQDEHGCRMLQFLKRVRTQMVRHIAQACPQQCHRVAAKSCGACTVDEVLYSFDVDNVVTCPRCDSAFHRHCWEVKVTDGCPNCSSVARRAAARR
jgi:hypothetical protein